MTYNPCDGVPPETPTHPNLQRMYESDLMRWKQHMAVRFPDPQVEKERQARLAYERRQELESNPNFDPYY